MAVRKRGDTYMADFMVAGNRFRETFDTSPEAEAWELETRAAIIKGSELPATKNGRSDTGSSLATLGALFEYTKDYHWENNPKIKAPEAQVASAREAVEHFGRNKLVSEINTDAMTDFVRTIVRSGRTHTTADRKLAALSKMLRFAAEKGVIPRVPKIPMSGEVNERLRYLTKDEAQRLLAYWNLVHDEEMHAFTVFALHCGARSGAIAALHWGYFGPSYRTVFFPGGDKKSPARTLPMSKPAIEAIQTMKRLHPDSKGPFAHFKKDGHQRTSWERMQLHTGFDDVIVHTLRHTCASWMVQRGVDLKRVQTWLGHKRIETTLIYAKLGTGDLDMCADILGDMLEVPKPQLALVGA
ncbi:tyrosine-type recombinase/integrase [Sinorhizobium medicae]|nr:tyrosine-type recombinase/integrase [Sinorhizobium medicae]